MNDECNACLVGYGGHSYVAYDILLANQVFVNYYLDQEIKSFNPFSLEYLGDELGIDKNTFGKYSFPSLGDNYARAKSINLLKSHNVNFLTLFTLLPLFQNIQR